MSALVNSIPPVAYERPPTFPFALCWHCLKPFGDPFTVWTIDASRVYGEGARRYTHESCAGAAVAAMGWITVTARELEARSQVGRL